MPTTSHEHWYDQTTDNGYPLSDLATRVDDAGQVLQSGIIIDAKIKFPDSLGSDLYFSALTSGPGMCTVMINACSDPSTPGVPVAAATLVKKSDRMMVRLTPLVKGVGGWIVFGPVVIDDALVSHRFSTPSQSILSRRAASSYEALPVSSMKGDQAGDALTGIVNLVGQAPFTIAKEVRTINGKPRNCIVMSLSDGQGDEFSTATTPIIQTYLGPCDTRPESNTCPDPQPIESISQVQPSCAGQIILDFQGCASVTRYTDGHGFVLNCSMPRQAVCSAPQIADSDGKLPNEYQPVIITGTTTTTTGSTQPPDGTTPGTITLPFEVCFRAGTAPNFAAIEGSFSFTSAFGSDPNADGYCTAFSDLGQALQAEDIFDTNLAGWVGTDMKTVDRYTLCHLKLVPGDIGAQRNGGLMINYRFSGGTPRYFLILIDYPTQNLLIRYYNGFTLVTIAQTEMVVTMGDWYSVSVTTVDEGNLGVRLNANATNLDEGGSWDLSSFNLLYYRPSDGIDGIAAYNSQTVFSHFHHEAV